MLWREMELASDSLVLYCVQRAWGSWKQAHTTIAGLGVAKRGVCDVILLYTPCFLLNALFCQAISASLKHVLLCILCHAHSAALENRHACQGTQRQQRQPGQMHDCKSVQNSSHAQARQIQGEADG